MAIRWKITSESPTAIRIHPQTVWVPAGGSSTRWTRFSWKIPNVIDCVESKFFAVGVESCTVGSNEFYTAYAATQPNVYNLMDAGHYYPSEYISDKISSMLLYFQYVPLHVTRGVNWDSDHVVSFDDETREICKEIVRSDALDRVLVGLDFFDASINRAAAWVIGCRNFQKSLLWALLQPDAELRSIWTQPALSGKYPRDLKRQA